MERPYLFRVYPRVGGGTGCHRHAYAIGRGLSPRGRGNRACGCGWSNEQRSIPAWAGEPSRATSTTLGTTVYPRVGGGTRWPLSADRRKAGLSPRGRGNRVQAQRPRPPEGSIPAWAGEPYPAVASNSCVTVYPRVGGGTHVKSLGCHCQGGLSPRGRGNRLPAVAERAPRRSIPAWAGEPSRTCGSSSGMTVYPRVGGGTSAHSFPVSGKQGLSPRGRGNRPVRQSPNVGGRSIPAWAGEPKRSGYSGKNHRVYPRVGGGTQLRKTARKRIWGLSPRGRGNRDPGTVRTLRNRSIPAWAGEPDSGIVAYLFVEVYPRVGGGTPARWRPGLRITGLSPRGRGNRPVSGVIVTDGGSIPAWAGEPTCPAIAKRRRKVYPRVGGGTQKVWL